MLHNVYYTMPISLRIDNIIIHFNMLLVAVACCVEVEEVRAEGRGKILAFLGFFQENQPSIRSLHQHQRQNGIAS